jgi:hypothetical protein
MQVSSKTWVMRSAMKPAGIKLEGRNLVLIRLIPLWRPAKQHQYSCIKTESEPIFSAENRPVFDRDVGRLYVGIRVSSRVITSRAKKRAHSTEEDRPDILKRRQEWFDGQLDLDPACLVLSTRDLGIHQYGAPSWPVHERRASEDQRSSGPLEN